MRRRHGSRQSVLKPGPSRFLCSGSTVVDNDAFSCGYIFIIFSGNFLVMIIMCLAFSPAVVTFHEMTLCQCLVCTLDKYGSRVAPMKWGETLMIADSGLNRPVCHLIVPNKDSTFFPCVSLSPRAKFGVFGMKSTRQGEIDYIVANLLKKASFA